MRMNVNRIRSATYEFLNKFKEMVTTSLKQPFESQKRV
jgi:hypothetical protein